MKNADEHRSGLITAAIVALGCADFMSLIRLCKELGIDFRLPLKELRLKLLALDGEGA